MRLLKIVLVSGVVFAGWGQSAVQARPKLYTMSCGQAQSFIQKSGSAVVDTSPTTFKKIVANGQYCERTERLRPYYTQTRDNPKCNVGYRCARRTMTGR